MFLLNSVRKQAVAWILRLREDPQLKDVVIYKKFVSRIYSEEVGHNIDTFDNYEIIAIKTEHTKESIDVAREYPPTSELQIGDRLYIFIPTELPEGISLKDELVGGDAKVYSIKSIQPIYGIVTLITVDGSE